MQALSSPSWRWWVVLGLSITGLIGAIVWGFFSYQGLQGRLADLSRTVVPGELDIDVPAPETLTIFFEDPAADSTFLVRTSDSNTLAVSPVELVVTGPRGEVAVAPYERDLRFDYDGRVVTAFARIEAPTSGRYTIRVSGDVLSNARVSVGEVIDFGFVANAAGPVVLFFVAISALVATVVVIAVKQSRSYSDVSVERSPVNV